MVQQLTIFDALPSTISEAFEVGDTVIVVAKPNESDIEDYYYLQDYAGLTGRIVKVIRGPVLQYEVEFAKKRNGIIYHEELRRG
ncbi:hypothetical protein MKY34_16850 [Sporosarcina sp. FSL K6-1522]|uniref:hypothetical protein n=1 Tax=Sporosarcina sp. FSL K6-1522 TaxID=2921554 RepID=UPI003159D6F5